MLLESYMACKQQGQWAREALVFVFMSLIRAGARIRIVLIESKLTVAIFTLRLVRARFLLA